MLPLVSDWVLHNRLYSFVGKRSPMREHASLLFLRLPTAISPLKPALNNKRPHCFLAALWISVARQFGWNENLSELSSAVVPLNRPVGGGDGNEGFPCLRRSANPV